MKKKFLLLAVTVTFIFTSCVSTPSTKKEENNEYDDLFLAQEEIVEESKIEYKQGNNKKKFFTRIDKQRPIIGFEGDCGTVYFECDTGAPYSYITKSGLKKGFNNYSQIEKQLLAGYKKYLIEEEKENLESISAEKLKERYYKDSNKRNGYCSLSFCFVENNMKYNIKNILYIPQENSNNKIDGMLGQDFFEQYKNVSFDYKNGYVIF